ncbi:hypothetical protein [Frigidibacter sp. ROC022]|uniref:hypothetical protein n=1 Tax=Frigidibacter sp. ROC022 TaxID=2971796 RepID=UPI00215B599C|nr:hypothetical protein [Frigidibacter sp. ROC022]MCR8722806.1 hypothetical protein [Frigidibacter sp. ROC022]
MAASNRFSLSGFVRRRRPWEAITIPFIFAMIIPFVFLDLAVTIYQRFSFPLYGIPVVRRRDYIVIDRHRLSYLHFMRKLWCVYCGYCNGVLPYVQEVAARTEHYWCPVKHARMPKDAHRFQKDFLPYGEGEDFLNNWFDMRDKARACEDCDSCGPDAAAPGARVASVSPDSRAAAFPGRDSRRPRE